MQPSETYGQLGEVRLGIRVLSSSSVAIPRARESVTHLQSPSTALRLHNSWREMDDKDHVQTEPGKDKVNLRQRKPCHLCALGRPCWGQLG